MLPWCQARALLGDATGRAGGLAGAPGSAHGARRGPRSPDGAPDVVPISSSTSLPRAIWDFMT